MESLRVIKLDDGKEAKVLSMEGYNDGYYWDMTAEVVIDETKYTVSEAGSGSGYVSGYSSFTKDGEHRLTGVERTKAEHLDKDEIEWMESAISYNYNEFKESGAKESWIRAEKKFCDYETEIDGVIVESEEDDDEEDD